MTGKELRELLGIDRTISEVLEGCAVSVFEQGSMASQIDVREKYPKLVSVLIDENDALIVRAKFTGTDSFGNERYVSFSVDETKGVTFRNLDPVKLNEPTRGEKEAQEAALALRKAEEIADELRDRGYLAPFHMETLSGFPVFGITGIGAFYRHIPDDGLGLIIYSPHIGIDSEGKLGHLDREGIKEPGKSYGANHILIEYLKRD